ncbi:GmrSD restriction endonuclease domain-containing protein [Glutamicibacter arilaitensis]|uniref:GmrSD restriction endonuclease domain-containing protein n=1 Tax=Glutamicibacter arilaitensis TaxID=256701 RepID=UPI003F914286
MSHSIAQNDVQAIAVGQLFVPGAPSYSVPLYQRNYTWGEEQIHRLVHDILDEAEKEESKDYFLGNLVVANARHNDESLDVIDGQQRLTTLYILLLKLSSRSSDKNLIGPLQPLIYEAREKATRALRGISERHEQVEEEQNNREDTGIIRASAIIEQLLAGANEGARLQQRRVIEYLLTKVLLVRMPIDRSTDLNRYFEIMNTRGAQLNPVDIVKARLLRYLPESSDRQLLNRVWTACADMDHYVAMTVTAGDTAQRAEVFGPGWNEIPSSDFTRLKEQLVFRDAESLSPVDHETSVTTESFALTLDQALEQYSQAPVTTELAETYGDERFTSQITFPTFLLQVLAVTENRDGSLRADDRQLDDKLLVQRFSDRVDSLQYSERAVWVRKFTTDLLRIRFLFDQFILKRDATLMAGHESTTDQEPGSWSLYRLGRSSYRRGSSKQDTPKYTSTFVDGESGAGPRSLQRRILLLQSALRITYTSPRTMHWMTEALRYVNDVAVLNEHITGDGFLRCLESHARKNLRLAMSSVSNDTSPDGMALGFAIPRIVFTYLDYLLVDEMNQWDFTFSYRTSIEHFSPRTEDTEHSNDAYRLSDQDLLDWLGNLALVTVSTNSMFSNYLPAQKANNHAARRQSLKLELMAKQAESGSWNDDDVKNHHEKMMELLRRALADE